MKCSKCGCEVEYRGAFDTVDGVRYKEYVCLECQHVELGERLEPEG